MPSKLQKKRRSTQQYHSECQSKVRRTDYEATEIIPGDIRQQNDAIHDSITQHHQPRVMNNTNDHNRESIATNSSYKYKVKHRQQIREKKNQYAALQREQLREKTNKYAEAHRKELREKTNKYAEAHRKELREKTNKYAEAHRKELREKTNKYAEAHRKELREKTNKYAEAHRKELREKTNKYAEAHRKELREKTNKYAEAHRKELREKTNKYTEAHRGQIRASQRRHYNNRAPEIRQLKYNYQRQRQQIIIGKQTKFDMQKIVEEHRQYKTDNLNKSSMKFKVVVPPPLMYHKYNRWHRYQLNQQIQERMHERHLAKIMLSWQKFPCNKIKMHKTSAVIKMYQMLIIQRIVRSCMAVRKRAMNKYTPLAHLIQTKMIEFMKVLPHN